MVSSLLMHKKSRIAVFFFFNDPPPPEISPLPLHDALPICLPWTWPRQDYIARLEEEEKRRSNRQPRAAARGRPPPCAPLPWLAVRGRSTRPPPRSEEHTSELQSQSNLVCRLLLEKKKLV